MQRIGAIYASDVGGCAIGGLFGWRRFVHVGRGVGGAGVFMQAPIVSDRGRRAAGGMESGAGDRANERGE